MYLQPYGERYAGNSETIEAVRFGSLVQQVLELRRIGCEQCDVHHALGDALLGGVQVHVHAANTLAARTAAAWHRRRDETGLGRRVRCLRTALQW